MSQELKLIKEYKKKVYLNDSAIVYKELDIIYRQKKEFFVCFYLDTQNKIIAREIISIGTLNSALVHPREVYKTAIIKSCNAIIIAHNHPSGDLHFSQEDLNVTEQLKKAGQIIGIKLLDSIIVTQEGYESLNKNGEL